MRITILILFLLFALLPPDAQRWLVSLLRDMYMSQQGQSIGAGAVGASLAAMFWYGWGWNSAVDHVYREDIRRAEEALQRRRR